MLEFLRGIVWTAVLAAIFLLNGFVLAGIGFASRDWQGIAFGAVSAGVGLGFAQLAQRAP